MKTSYSWFSSRQSAVSGQLGKMEDSYRKLVVWQKAMDLVVKGYRVTASFPKAELYSLVSQIRRCLVSIPSNIAEGRHRSSQKEFALFLRNAYASAAELETQLEIAHRIGYLKEDLYKELLTDLKEVSKMLNSLLRKVKKADS